MKKWSIVLIFFISFILISCQKENVDENDHSEQNDMEENEALDEAEEPEAPVYSNVYPLTGVPTNDSVNNRIVAVMINNHPAARPQSGVSKADIIFEILAEGGITRWLVLFQSEQPEMVGPVRSAREYYFDLTERYDGLYVYHGAAEVVEEEIQARNIDRLNGSIYDNDGHLFSRESFRHAPHNSYLYFDKVYDVAEDKGYDIISDVEPLTFLSDDHNVDGEHAEHFTLTYPGRSESELVEFTYNPAAEAYERFESGEATIEYESNEPVRMENVFVIETTHEVIDKQGRRSIDLTSGGQALLFQKGKVNHIEWTNDDGRIVPTKNGQKIGLIPGQTWINVMPTNPGIKQSVIINNE